MDFTKHDQLIKDLLPKLEAFQDEYIKTHQVYWQSPASISTAPTADTKADLTTKIPGKEASWADVDFTVGDLPFSVLVHEYQAKDGKGWSVIFMASDGEREYIKSVGCGCESERRTTDWEEYKPKQWL